MKKAVLLILCLSLLIPLTGCIKTYTYQAERKDQDISGNRGIIMGDVPSPEIGRTRTRTMGAVDVNLPASREYKARKTAVTQEPVARKEFTREPAPMESERIEPMRKIEKPIAVPAQQYTVQKDDTLQKISEKFYGTTKKWTRIYDANKDILTHPSKIYPGQVITIPACDITQKETDIK